MSRLIEEAREYWCKAQATPENRERAEREFWHSGVARVYREIVRDAHTVESQPEDRPDEEASDMMLPARI